MVALFVYLLETGCWAGCAPDLSPQVVPVAACGNWSLHGYAKPRHFLPKELDRSGAWKVSRWWKGLMPRQAR